jgi:hypothetical protein
LPKTLLGDFAISGGVLPLVTDPALAGAIKLRNRFRLFAGEWFLDTRVGVPYFTSVFGVKNPDLRLLRQLFTRVILQTPPFVAVSELDVTFDASTRTAALTFIAQTDTGALVKFSGDGEPFIISPGGAS